MFCPLKKFGVKIAMKKHNTQIISNMAYRLMKPPPGAAAPRESPLIPFPPPT